MRFWRFQIRWWDFVKEKHHQKEKVLQEFHRSICWVFHFEFFWINKKSAIKIWVNSKNANKNELLKQKKEILLKILFNRETALFWDFIEKNSVRYEVSSFMKIRIVSHEIWQVFEFQVFKALMKTIAEIIKNRIKNDVLKFCYEFYRNFWFLVKKKKKNRLINVVLKMNWVIIRDANLLSAINEFFEKFANCVIVLLVNQFFEYNQLSLIEKCRDMIVFMISLDLMKMTTIFMKTINFVIQFVRMINKIIVDYVFHHASLFVNDIKIKK